jgi:hypothetical protein
MMTTQGPGIHGDYPRDDQRLDGGSNQVSTAAERAAPPAHWVLHALTLGEDDARSFTATSNWATAGQLLDENDRLWRQYQVLVDVYKFYLEIAWKASVWYYATTGIILAFLLNNLGGARAGSLPLVLPFLALMSVGFSYLCLKGARHLSGMIRLFEYSSVQLNLPGRPHVEFGVAFLLINSLMFFVVAVASLVLFVPLAYEISLP